MFNLDPAILRSFLASTRSPVSTNEVHNAANGMAWVSSSHGRQIEGAVMGGSEPGGMYVGRVRHNSGDLLPGKVHLNYGFIYVPYGGKEHNFSSYEVLTELNPSNPVTEWRHSQHGIVPSTAIQGGVTSRGERLYIGRARIRGVLTCGKIHPSHHALYVSYGGKEYAFKEGYEILIYRTPPRRPQISGGVAHATSASSHPPTPGRGRLPLTSSVARASVPRAPARPPPPGRGVPGHEIENRRNSATAMTSWAGPYSISNEGVPTEQPNPEGSFTCQICFEKYDGNWGLVHGGTMHAGYCEGCVQTLRRDKAPCPQCRCGVEAVIKVFMN